jgi:hypothetical protein
MRAFLLSLLAAAASAQDTFPPGYWERGYSTSENYAQYNVTLRVRDLARAEADVDRLMAKAGGTLSNLGGRSGRTKTVSYSVPAKKADAASKSLFDVGELQQFSNYGGRVDSQAGEIDEKIKTLKGELAANSAALKRMPAATSLMNAQLNRLIQARTAIDNSLAKAVLHINLNLPPEEK